MVQKGKKLSPLEGTALGDNAADASLDLEGIPYLRERVIGRTNIGRGRETNQDAAGAHFFYRKKNPCVIVSVADGLGFYRYSHRASFEAVRTIPRDLAEGRGIIESCRHFHKRLIEGFPYSVKGFVSDPSQISTEQDAEKRQGEDRGSTTLVLGEILGDKLRIANIGDSRAYLIRNGQIIYRSRDQTLVELLITRGILERSPAVIRHHPMRNVVLNALGSPEPYYEFEEKGLAVAKPSGIPWVDELQLQVGDLLFLASDGAFTNLTDDQIVELLSKNDWEELNQKIHETLQGILKAGKTFLNEPANPDNYTFVVYRHM